MKRILSLLLFIAPIAAAVAAQTPQWIWPDKAQGNESVFFRKVIELPAGKAKSAKLEATCDNGFTLFVNGKQVLKGGNWGQTYRADVTKLLRPGKNVLAAEGRNAGGPAGFVARLTVEIDGKKIVVVTDTSWQTTRKKSKGWETAAFKLEGWAKSVVTGRMGSGPWGDVFAGKSKGGDDTGAASIKPASGEIEVAEGFKAELLYTVPKGEQGSWVSLCVDDKGRLIASDQGGKGLYRIDVSGKETKVQKMDIAVTSAQGLLHAFGSLWVNVNGGGSGVYRFTDTNGDGKYDKKETIKLLAGGGEHGPHALVLSPDKKHIYVIAGNHTKLPKTDSSMVPKVWKEDLLLKRLPDANGHARNIRAPGGWIARFGPDGKNWETVAIGFRNSYDMAFNLDGELFAYDSDMEWDAGAPWYRPTRLYHIASGADFGWRTGDGKWPAWYPDCLPPIYDIGPGSPVGVTSGLGAKFPAKYQKAIYCLDWTYGTISAMHLKAEGASYSGTREEFVASSRFRLTDAVINPKDGAMYFTIGGRGQQSALYKVTYTGSQSTAPVKTKSPNADARALRRELEALHTRKAGAVVSAWKHLGSKDRHLRWAARVAIEHQPVAEWAAEALAEADPQAALTALCALARLGDKSLQPKLLTALSKLEWDKLNIGQRAELLRVYQLAFIRMGKPSAADAAAVEKKLDALFPAPVNLLNYELCSLLVYLESPNVIAKTLKLLAQSTDQSQYDWAESLLARNTGYARAFAAAAASPPQRDQIHYAKELRNLAQHWTAEQRMEYFRWYRKAEKFKGGNSFAKFLRNFRNEALAKTPPAERAAINALQQEAVETGPPFPIDVTVKIGVTNPLKFDKAEFTVKPGAAVALVFTNNDTMPMIHNLVLIQPGARFEIVAAAANMGAAGLVKEFVPKSDNVIAHTPLVLHRNTFTLYFKAPTKPGNYEYLCTYPGHGLTMWGTMRVK
jgi:azurin/glucose/arabinose dehydrogenase